MPLGRRKRTLTCEEKWAKDQRQRQGVTRFALVCLGVGGAALILGIELGALLIAVGLTCFGAILAWFPPVDPEG